MRTWLGVCALWSLGACAPAPEITAVTLELHSLPSCALPAAPRIVVRATGDFPAPKPPPALAPGMPATLDGLPTGTRFLGIEAQAGDQPFGSLVARAAGDEQRGVLLLPLDANSSCPLGDPLAVAPRGAAVTALPGGGLLIAGGSDADGTTLTSAVVLRPGQALVDDVVGGMYLPRAGASATPVDARVVIAGGGSDDSGSAQYNLEVYDTAKGVFDRASDEKLSGPRRDHGAARLGDGRVLLVGGCAKLGAASGSGADAGASDVGDLPRCVELKGSPLASAELIDLDAPAGMVAHATHDLIAARIAPSVLVLDSGTVLVALGWDEQGALVGSLERFDPRSETFTAVGPPLPLHQYAAVAALEGDRIAFLGCDGPGHACALALLLPDAENGFVDAGELISSEDLAASGLSDLAQVALLALDDGRLFVAGRAPDAPIVRRGFVVDLNRLTVESDERSLSRVPDRLLELEDGTRVELNAAGVSLARAGITSPLDAAPAALLARNQLGVVLDAPGRWETANSGGLHALPGSGQATCASGGASSSCYRARLDLPYLRFADMQVELTLEGAGQLLFEPQAAPPIAVALGTTTLSLGSCAISRVPGEAMVVERHAASLVLQSGNNRRACDVARLAGRTGIALRVEGDAQLRQLSVTRL